ncbi:hypothetical protein HK405_004536 [Cladochytrium tenue]|nr:hypothetical protein HK405_004536 [Cladochytrium tenue]
MSVARQSLATATAVLSSWSLLAALGWPGPVLATNTYPPALQDFRAGDSGFVRREVAGNDVTAATGFYEYAHCRVVPSTSWGLGFDNGPSSHTDDVVQALDAQVFKATFFVTGTSITSATQSALAATYNAGHQIGWNGTDYTTMMDAEIHDDIVRTAKAIFKVIGKVPKYIRPPYGAAGINNNVRDVIKSLGLRLILWNADSNDGVAGTVAATIESTVSSWTGSQYDKSIVLFHDDNAETASALPSILDTLNSKSVQPLTMAACLGYDQSDAYADSPLMALVVDDAKSLAANNSEIGPIDQPVNQLKRGLELPPVNQAPEPGGVYEQMIGNTKLEAAILNMGPVDQLTMLSRRLIMRFLGLRRRSSVSSSDIGSVSASSSVSGSISASSSVSGSGSGSMSISASCATSSVSSTVAGYAVSSSATGAGSNYGVSGSPSSNVTSDSAVSIATSSPCTSASRAGILYSAAVGGRATIGLSTLAVSLLGFIIALLI